MLTFASYGGIPLWICSATLSAYHMLKFCHRQDLHDLLIESSSVQDAGTLTAMNIILQ